MNNNAPARIRPSSKAQLYTALHLDGSKILQEPAKAAVKRVDLDHGGPGTCTNDTVWGQAVPALKLAHSRLGRGANVPSAATPTAV